MLSRSEAYLESFTAKHGMSLRQRGEVLCCVSDKTDEEAAAILPVIMVRPLYPFSSGVLESQVETGRLPVSLLL